MEGTILLGQENTAILLEVSMSRNSAQNLLKVIKAWIDGGKKEVDGVEVSHLGLPSAGPPEPNH